MSSNLLGKRGANGVEHPAQEILLAFVREQCTEQEQTCIQEHLLAGCVPCNRLLAELKQSSNALNHLKYLSRYLYYPELQSNQVLLHMQRGEPLTSAWTGKRKRKFQTRHRPVSRPQATGRYTRKTGLRFVSIPAAFAMFVLFVLLVATLVYALASIGKLPFSIEWPITILHNDPELNNTSFEKHQITPTATVAVTITPSPDLTLSPSPTLAPTIIMGAELVDCTRSQYAGQALLICGHGFKGVNKVWLEIEYSGGNSLKTIGPFIVNSAGEFKAYLSISCKYSPIAIYAADKTHQPLTVPLTSISRSGCYTPTSTVMPGGHPYPDG